jgi:hypothetical protein
MGDFYFIPSFTRGSCLILLGKLVQKVLQKWTVRIEKEYFFSIVVVKKGNSHSLQKKESWMSEVINGRSALGKICFSTYFINFPTSTKIFNTSQQKQGHNCVSKSGKVTLQSLWTCRD